VSLGSTAVLAALAVVVLMLPVKTRQGVNYEVSEHRVPLYLKLTDFVNRSVQYEQIAGEIARDLPTEESRAVAVFEWTRRNIRSTPDGFPVVDDHILNIITRGYGQPDQQADVFATLSTYAGVPAFWQTLRVSDSDGGLILAFALIDRRWRVFDVAGGVAFRNERNELATLDEVRGTPALAPARLRNVVIGTVSYADRLARAALPEIPDPLRSELQMPGARLWHEAKVLLHLERDGVDSDQ
jgi:hypothetical protein